VLAEGGELQERRTTSVATMRSKKSACTSSIPAMSA
jgi:hypothetical protein